LLLLKWYYRPVCGPFGLSTFVFGKKPRKTMQDLGTFGGNYGNANAINEAGEVVGWASNAGDQALFAFLWQNGL